MYVQKGRVKLSVIARAGKEAVVGVLGRGDCFGEGCLAGQPVRMGSVTAMSATTVRHRRGGDHCDEDRREHGAIVSPPVS
jgi:CRP-like cAMP-binding protein